MNEGGVLGYALGYALMLRCVEGGADEERETHGGDAEGWARDGAMQSADDEGEDERDAGEDKESGGAEVCDEKNRPDHAHCEGDGEANGGMLLPVHYRALNSLMRCSG